MKVYFASLNGARCICDKKMVVRGKRDDGFVAGAVTARQIRETLAIHGIHIRTIQRTEGRVERVILPVLSADSSLPLGYREHPRFLRNRAEESRLGLQAISRLV